jgi:UDP-glucuronate decarboxylase
MGGSGFLGNIFKQYLLYLGKGWAFPIKVIAVDNYIKGTTTLNEEIRDPNLTTINHDLIYPLGLKLFGIQNIDYIINASGNASPKNYEKFPLETMEVSSTAVKHLLEIALFYKARIINFSSSEVLGTPDDKDIPTGEEVIPKIHSQNKRSPYDVSKLYIETLSWVFRSKYNVKSFVIRPFNVIGGFHPNDYRVIPNFLGKVLRNEKMLLYKPGTQTRTFCYFTDFIVGVFKVLLSGTSHLYHIGNDKNEISMLGLAQLIEKTAGKSNLIELIDTPEVYVHEPKRRCPSIEKARNEWIIILR